MQVAAGLDDVDPLDGLEHYDQYELAAEARAYELWGIASGDDETLVPPMSEAVAQ